MINLKELGNILKKARMEKGLTLEDIHHQTKIRRDYLAAIEEGEFGNLQAEVYLKGFLVNFARCVDLDGEEILKRYYELKGEREENPIREEDEEESEPRPPQSLAKLKLAVTLGANRKHLPAWAALIIILLLGGSLYLFWEFWGKPAISPPLQPGVQDRAQVSVDGPPATIDGAEAPKVTVANKEPSAPPVLEARATDTVWVGLYQKESRKVIFEGTLQPNEIRKWNFSSGVVIRIGNAAGIRLFFRGKDLGVLGEKGEVITREILPDSD